MTLGEHIRTLRMRYNLSQEDLAARLEVSRQSVSKWETNASVPDLDKLVKLSDLFDMTLDALVRGETAVPAPTYIPQPVARPRPVWQIVGIVLLGIAGIILLVCILSGGQLSSGLILALPFVVSGTICLTVSWHPGLLCAWSISALLDIFVVSGIRFNWRAVLRSLRYLPQNWPLQDWQWFDLAMMAVQLAWIVFLMVWLCKCLQPRIPSLDGKKRNLPTAGWLLFVLLHAPWLWMAARLEILRVILIVTTDWLRFALLALLLACQSADRRHKSA